MGKQFGEAHRADRASPLPPIHARFPLSSSTLSVPQPSNPYTYPPLSLSPSLQASSTLLVTNYPNAYQNSTFQSQPASFGYYYYQSKVYTRLLIYDPTNKNLCNPPDPDHISLKLDPNESYMLLAQRGDCFFNEKAGIAQQYSNLCGGCVQGVVVYDNMQTDQITQMSKVSPYHKLLSSPPTLPL